MRAAIVNNGVVENIIVVDPENPVEGAIACDDEIGIGWSHKKGIFTPPYVPPPVDVPEEPAP